MKYVVVNCPYCDYWWRARGTDRTGKFKAGYDLPKSCSRCKRRFDVDWAMEKLHVEKKEFANYRELLVFLKSKNSEKKG